MVKPYWQKRSEQIIIDSEKISAQMEKNRLKQAYQVAYNNILSQINGVQASLTEQGFSVDMAKSLNSQQKRDYASLVRQYNAEAKKIAKNGDYRELKPLSTVIKGSRLTAFKNQLDIELSLLAADKEEMIGDTLQDVYKHASYKTVYDLSKQVGAQVAFDRIDKKTALKAVKTNFAGTNFSSSIWQDKNKLSQSLQSLIPQQFIIGTSTQNIARQLRDKLNVSYRNAIRLARTETNFVANMGMEDTYKRAGVEKYQVLATLDSRTSDICQEMDGYIGELSKAMPGVNYPPFHPNCRTTTIPYFDDEETEQRIARNEDNENEFDENMSYGEWAKKVLKADLDNVPQAEPEELRGADAIPDLKPKKIDPEEITDYQNKILLPGTKSFIDRYTGIYYADINGDLRKRKKLSTEMEFVIANLMQLKTSKNYRVYRGENTDFLKQEPGLAPTVKKILALPPKEAAQKLKEIFSGEIIKDRAFKSTSADEFVAIDFAKRAAGDDERHQVRWVIDIPKGSRGVLYTDAYSSNPGESEVLLPPNSGFKIKTVEYDEKNKSYIIRANFVNLEGQ